MAKAKQTVTNYRCWYKEKSGKHCQTIVKRYGERCAKHRHLW